MKKTNQVSVAVPFMTSIRRCLGRISVVIQNILSVFQSLHRNAGIFSRLHHYNFLPNRCQFITHLSSYHITFCRLKTRRCRKMNHGKSPWTKWDINMDNYLLCDILSVVLYGWETWSLTLREKHRLSVFENRVLREYLVRREIKWREVGQTAEREVS
jgi:hypothetical protein